MSSMEASLKHKDAAQLHFDAVSHSLGPRQSAQRAWLLGSHKRKAEFENINMPFFFTGFSSWLG
jgi:hypothetical protein